MTLATIWLVPALVPGDAFAGQIVPRSLSISSGVPGATGLSYTYTFTQPTVTTIQSIKFVACTTATSTYSLSGSTLGSCTAPTGLNINAGSQVGTLAGNWQNTTGFTRQSSNLNDCDENGNNNVLCITRTATSPNETATSKTLTWNTQTNPTTANSTFYIGMYLYSDASFNSPTDSGTVASAVVQTLTVDAAVAEILQFCIGSTAVDDATTAVGSCSSVSGTTVNIGTLDPTTINISPVNAGGGNNVNGVAVLRTNAINGSSVSYDAIQASSGTNHLGALRITGASCNAGNVNTDQCINSAGTTQTTFTAGTEDFGMTIGGTNCGTVTANSYYTCIYSSGSEHLVPSTNYVGATGSYGTTNGFAWQESGASTQIASAATNNTVADEALILKFAATPSISTPFGSYSVQVDFTTVATY
ncbi:MAG TPA: hypothetical protein VEH48_01810 [Candidatus Nitrosopolaris sp.]|nr:hypothetical protein [Candidatus Nitrosopolaris sp.]